MAIQKVQQRTRAPLQKSVQRLLKNKHQQKPVTEVNKKDGKAIIIAQEIKFIRLLSSNDKRVRDKVLKNLRKWLTVRAESTFAFTEADFMRLWKGLFYCMWMSDKPLIQEEVAESISKIVHCFNVKDVVLLYTLCALKTLSIEWFGIDQYRLDKFSMLVRRIIRQTFKKCKENSWDIEWVKGISEVLEKVLVDPKTCLGFSMHLTEVFLEELSKISDGVISEDAVTEFIKPFISYFIIMDDERQIKHVTKHIFKYLIIQSDIGMDYMEKFKAWRDAGFPAGSIDAMEKIEISDEKTQDSNATEEEIFLQNQMKPDTEKVLDPRAGRVNVELPQIPFNAKKIVTLLTQYKFHSSSTAKSRRQLNSLINEFTELSGGKMPIGIKEIRLPNVRKKDTDTKLAAKRLLEFEKNLHSDTMQKKRKRKRNGQLTQDEYDKLNGEGSEDIDIESSMAKVPKIEITKRKKMQHKIDIINNLKQKNPQVSHEKVLRLKKKKYETKESDGDDNCKIDVRNSKCKSKKNSLLLMKNGNESKKIKLKKNKAAIVNTLNVITPIRKNKITKVKVCGKWDVSDNTDTSTPLLLNDNKTKSHTEVVKTPVTSDIVQKDNSFNGQLKWMEPVLKKLKNDINKAPVSLKEQHKINTNLNSKKRVKIALQHNTVQHKSEYILQLRKSPSIPFDASKKPLVGVLKASPIPSPINPFYKRKY
ncbi:ribosomal RNA processing protein 1 homolog Nnp-1 [Colletes latitarsis]|uniref:ribosomal RNA processing protein 1 homolog Nnp-1 n=1 Tax=Colletes latitarsis TaxID=2605962 RepID=UPI004036E76C